MLAIASRVCSPRATRQVFASANRTRCTQYKRLATQIWLQSRWHSNDSASPLTHPPSSVSQNEVLHFTKLASSWWDPYGPSRLLHLMNPVRHEFILSCISPHSQNLEVDTGKKFRYLDIGCGGGIFASSAARLLSTDSVTAIDPTTEVINVAKSHQKTDPAIPEPKLTYLNCAIENLTEHSPHVSFDIITLFEVIEHISNPSSFLESALQYLKPGGWLIGSTIARHPISYVTTKIIAEAPFVGIVPRGTHDWNQYINPNELTAWFQRENARTKNLESNEETGDVWSNVRIEGVVYVPLMGWTRINGSERVGNYFFGVQKLK